ncbi:MAG: PAS domain S-box protein [Caldilinea sp.]|nr:PAS domain S-box protein [Caldilinea sp.]MDW8440947.1 PAS domain S-box protein [Caldilineaceae bacterium]
MGAMPKARVMELEAQLRTQKELLADFHQVFEHSDEAVWIYDVQSRSFRYISPGFERLFGLPVDILHSDPLAFLKVVIAEDVSFVHAAFSRSAQGEPIDIEFRISHPDGSPRRLRIRSRPTFNSQGEHVRTLNVASDLTALRAAQEAAHHLKQRLEAHPEERTQTSQLNERRLRQIIDLAPYLIYVKDLEGRYLLINRAAAAALGLTPEEVIGRRDVEVQPSSEAALHFREEDLQVIREGVTLSIREEQAQFHDGTVHTLQTIKQPLRLEGQDAPVVLGVGIDITELKQTEAALRAIEAELRRSHEELQAANAALQNAARMKDEFMATVSHELRTPLSSILGLTEALQTEMHGALNDQQRRLLKLIQTSAHDLLSLINNLIDFSRIEAGEIFLQIESFDAVALSRLAVARIAPEAESKRQRIQFASSCDRLMVEGDQLRYIQILLNLLSNAIKFTPEHGELGVLVERDAATPTARITVWDHGIGIDEEGMAHLFRPFIQLDSSLRRRYPGVGLGLALTKRLVELLGGRIVVESAPGQGSRFTVVLPLLNSSL